MSPVVKYATLIRRLGGLALLSVAAIAVLVGVQSYYQQRELFIQTQTELLQRDYRKMQGRIHAQLEQHALQAQLIDSRRKRLSGCVDQAHQAELARTLAIRTRILGDATYQLESVAPQRLLELLGHSQLLPNFRVEPQRLLLSSYQPLGLDCAGGLGLLQNSVTVLEPELGMAPPTGNKNDFAMLVLHDQQVLLHLDFDFALRPGEAPHLSVLPADGPLPWRAQQSRWVAEGVLNAEVLLDGRVVTWLHEPNYGLHVLYYSRVLGGDFPAQFLRSNAVVIALQLALLAALLLSWFFVGHIVRVSTEYYRLSTFDFLTGLYNRRALMELAASELSRAERHGRPLCLLQLDIDFFKKVNDRYGHDGGDAILKLFASVLKASLRQGDIAARSGGEEFVLILPETDLAEAAVVAERLLKQVREARLDYQGSSVGVTCSLGIARWHGPEDGLQDLLMRADALLYQAKQQGRDRAVVEQPAPAQSACRRLVECPV